MQFHCSGPHHVTLGSKHQGGGVSKAEKGGGTGGKTPARVEKYQKAGISPQTAPLMRTDSPTKGYARNFLVIFPHVSLSHCL